MTAELIVFVALTFGGLVHTTAGFGLALVAMPVMTLIISVRIATPLLAIVGLSLSGLIFYQHREHWLWRESAPLIAGSIAGVPVGTYALTSLPPSLVLGFLGVVLLGYAGFELFRAANGSNKDNPSPALENNINHLHVTASASIAGFLSGVLGGAYAANGPPLIVYGAMRRWHKERFKSILQSLFIFNGVVIVIWQAYRGLITQDVGWYGLFAFPGLFLGMSIGRRIDRHLNHARFRRVLLGLLLVLGTLLLIRSRFA